jgi:hypothetical protein
MDMETVLPRTCKLCNGVGYLYYGDSNEYDTEACECQIKEKTNG